MLEIRHDASTLFIRAVRRQMVSCSQSFLLSCVLFSCIAQRVIQAAARSIAGSRQILVNWADSIVQLT